MTVELAIRAGLLVAVLTTAVIYGTDVFCAVVLKPALASADERILVAITGRVHRFGDRRMPFPGALGIVASAAVAIAAALTAHWTQAIAAGVAAALLVVWITLYLRVSAPINRRLTAAVDANQDLPDGRALQAKWDQVIGLRATLQGLSVAALCIALAV
jgi:hypothetical protein